MRLPFNFNLKTKIKFNLNQVLGIYRAAFFAISLTLLVWTSLFLYQHVYLTVSVIEISLPKNKTIPLLADINLTKFDQIISAIQTKTTPQPMKYYRDIFQPLSANEDN